MNRTSEQRNKDIVMLSDVRSFTTAFTSPDPFHANEYCPVATGDFAKQYH